MLLEGPDPRLLRRRLRLELGYNTPGLHNKIPAQDFRQGLGCSGTHFFIGSGVTLSRGSFPAGQNLKITSQGLDSIILY